MLPNRRGVIPEIKKKNEISKKFPNIWKLNNTLLMNPLVKEENSRRIGKHHKLNE